MRLPDEPPLADSVREIARRDDAVAEERRAAQARSFADGLRRAATATPVHARSAASPPTPPVPHDDPARALLARMRAFTQPAAERGPSPAPKSAATAKSDARRPVGKQISSGPAERPGHAPIAPAQPESLDAVVLSTDPCPTAALLDAAQTERAADAPAPSGARKRRFAQPTDGAECTVAPSRSTQNLTPIAELAAVPPAPAGTLQQDLAVTGMIEYARLAQAPGEVLAFHIGLNGLVPGGVRIVVSSLGRRRVSLRLSSRAALGTEFVDDLLALLAAHDIAVADCAMTCGPEMESR